MISIIGKREKRGTVSTTQTSQYKIFAMQNTMTFDISKASHARRTCLGSALRIAEVRYEFHQNYAVLFCFLFFPPSSADIICKLKIQSTLIAADLATECICFYH